MEGLSWIARMSTDSFDVVSVEIQKEGELVQKELMIKDFAAILNAAVVSESQLRLGKMPRGYYNASIDPNRTDTFQCVVVVPAGKRLIQYFDTIYEIPYPASVFHFSSVEGCLKRSRVYFVNTDEPDDSTTLYQYCFGNVASDTGEICWGQNLLPELDGLKSCDQLVALFFGSPCNDDYYSYSRFHAGAPEYCKVQRALYEHLSGCDKFPFEILANTSRRMVDLLVM